MQLQEEQAGIVERHGDAITKEAMAEMKYADAVVREGLRIKGPVSVGLKCVLAPWHILEFRLCCV